MSTTTWVLVFMLVGLKIPLAYVAWVIRWAVVSEPAVGTDGDRGIGVVPVTRWQPSVGPRPRRGGPHGSPVREAARVTRRARAGA